jgi:mono/diheme cytochrome c family protein
MRNLLLALALLAGACAGWRSRKATGEAVLSIAGKVEQGPYTFGRADLTTLPRRSFRAVPPGGDAPVKYDGVAVAAVLSDIVELGKDVDTVVFFGKDGYVVPIPMAAVRQLRPVLADVVGGSPTTSLQLAWPNVDQPGIDTDPRMRWWWVPGVSKLELHGWVATYGRALRVPPGGSDDARLGADAFSVQCMGCHKLRTVGGTRGPDLTQIASHRDPQALAASMREHLERVGPPDNEPAPSALRQIAAFLREVDLAGAKPDDEFQPPEPAPPHRPGAPAVPPAPHGA